eukprot:GHVS01073598.1.p2 GENE.GHVS01073598.1~~GHVS01073598.1.p2  ORF type:complete len:126 (+),score=26.98 GHVS01073598.1:485-862(+)
MLTIICNALPTSFDKKSDNASTSLDQKTLIDRQPNGQNKRFTGMKELKKNRTDEPKDPTTAAEAVGSDQADTTYQADIAAEEHHNTHQPGTDTTHLSATDTDKPTGKSIATEVTDPGSRCRETTC